MVVDVYDIVSKFFRIWVSDEEMLVYLSNGVGQVCTQSQSKVFKAGAGAQY